MVATCCVPNTQDMAIEIPEYVGKQVIEIRIVGATRICPYFLHSSSGVNLLFCFLTYLLNFLTAFNKSKA